MSKLATATRLGRLTLHAYAGEWRTRRLIYQLRRRLPAVSGPVSAHGAPDGNGVPMDLRLAHDLNRRGGFFVEAGANDGLFQSNTALLEQLWGWDGILVEPSPSACETCRAQRRAPVYNCALVSADFDGATLGGDFDGFPMASVGGTRLGRDVAIEVPARTLQSILDERRVSHVDFVSLDVEGYEMEILRGCDFGRITIGALLIELSSSSYASVVDLLADAGYVLVGNYSNYTRRFNPGWDGTHNDFLFRRRDSSTSPL